MQNLTEKGQSAEAVQISMSLAFNLQQVLLPVAQIEFEMSILSCLMQISSSPYFDFIIVMLHRSLKEQCLSTKQNQNTTETRLLVLIMQTTFSCMFDLVHIKLVGRTCSHLPYDSWVPRS